MGEFEKIYDIARELDCMDFIKRMEMIIENVNSQKFINVLVTGTRNIGKTTFINKIVGSEVWESGNMDDEEKPLRVSFEPPIPDDEFFQNILAENEAWRAKNVVLYEMRENDLISENSLIEEMYPFDLVFFLISATAPFRLDDLNFLKALSPLRRQVVVNGISYIHEHEREKVLNYINRLNAENGFPPVIVMEDDKDLGEIVRNFIPEDSELKEIRTQKLNDISLHILEKLERLIQDKIIQNEAAAKSFVAISSSDALENKKIILRLGELRADTLEYKNLASGSCIEKLDERFESITGKILNIIENSKLKENEIQKLVEQEYLNLGKSVIEKFQETFLADLQKISSSARILGVPNFNEKVRQSLDKISDTMNISIKPLSPFGRIQDETKNSSKNSSLFISTGILAGGLILSPLPTIISVAGSVVAAAGAGAMYVKNKNSERTAILEGNLKKAFREGVDNIKKLVWNFSDKCYGEIVEQLKKAEEDLSNVKPDLTRYDEEAAQLNSLLAKCQQLKNF